MVAERLVKWSKEAQEFFDNAEDKSVVLDLIISYGCVTQTGYAFEDLINSINTATMKRKIKKVNITDTSYLYRHCIAEFARYADKNVLSIWYMNNKTAINNLEVDVNLRSWAENVINNEKFSDWHRQKCVEFILEECAYVRAHLKDSIVAYPMEFYNSINYVIERYKLNLIHLHYKPSRYSQRKSENLKYVKMDENVFPFLSKVLNANFFMIDRNGKYIYKNNKLTEIIGDIPANIVAPEVWEVSMDIMRTRKQRIIEEEFQGTHYLSVKAPLIINGKVEGVIGLSVDITDRKQVEELKNELKIQKELYEIAKGVAHDICSPLSALEMVKYMSLDKLSPEEKKMFEMAIRSIRDISDSLIKKYRKEEEREDINSKYIAVFPGISDIVKEKSYQHQDKALKINFNHEEKDKFEFIKGNITDFQRVISNLLNNAVEAIEKKEGKVEVSYEVKGEEVEIRVRDNGEGMPREMVGKINRGEVVESTKEKGHGIGMEQVIKTVKKMEGQLEVRSKEQEGTEFILRFKKVEAPKWFKDKVKLNKGDTVVILDDDILVHEIWTKRLKKYEMDITIKYFSKGIEAIEFINSIEDKSKVFLFVEYELKGQEINGIKVIEKSGMQERHILMTNKYLGDIKEFKNKNNFLKTFSKMYLNDFNININ